MNKSKKAYAVRIAIIIAMFALILIAVDQLIIVPVAGQHKQDINNIETVITIQTSPGNWTTEYHMKDGSVRSIKCVEELIRGAQEDK